MLAGWIAVDFAFNAYGAIEGYSPAELRGAWLKYQEGWEGFYYVGGALPAIAVLSTAIHMAGREFEEYLALKWPAPREAVRAFGIFAIVLAGEGLVTYFAGVESCAPTSGLVVGGPSGLMIMLIGSCIAAGAPGVLMYSCTRSLPATEPVLVTSTLAWRVPFAPMLLRSILRFEVLNDV